MIKIWKKCRPAVEDELAERDSLRSKQVKEDEKSPEVLRSVAPLTPRKPSTAVSNNELMTTSLGVPSPCTITGGGGTSAVTTGNVPPVLEEGERAEEGCEELLEKGG